jgi:hypothetical protein
VLITYLHWNAAVFGIALDRIAACVVILFIARKGPGYVLGNAGITTIPTAARDMRELLEDIGSQEPRETQSEVITSPWPSPLRTSPREAGTPTGSPRPAEKRPCRPHISRTRRTMAE